MNKAELIERIIDTFTDMGSEAPEDIAYAKELTIDEAEMYLNELRANEREYLDPEDWLSKEITPAIYMEAFNCYLRKCRYDVTVARLAEFFILHESEAVDIYHEFDGEYQSSTDKYVIPTDWLTEFMEFPLYSHVASMLDLILLGQHSPEFNPKMDFCWIEIKNGDEYCTDNSLHSTDTPFADGLIDAKSFADWVLNDENRVGIIKDNYMINTDIDYVFNFD